MMRKKLLLAAALLVSANAAQAADGQQNIVNANCGAVPVAAGDMVGSVTNVTGDVIVSGLGGYDVASEGTKLNATSVLMTSADSTATISIGSKCNIAVQPDHQVTFKQDAGTKTVSVRLAKLNSDAVSSGVSTQEGGWRNDDDNLTGFFKFALTSGAIYSLRYVFPDSDRGPASLQ